MLSLPETFMAFYEPRLSLAYFLSEKFCRLKTCAANSARKADASAEPPSR